MWLTPVSNSTLDPILQEYHLDETAMFAWVPIGLLFVLASIGPSMLSCPHRLSSNETLLTILVRVGQGFARNTRPISFVGIKTSRQFLELAAGSLRCHRWLACTQSFTA